MKNGDKKIEVKAQRTIPAPVDEVFDAWFDPKVPGTTWNAAEKFILNPKVDGLFYWALRGTSHYGRFVEIERPVRIKHTWVSPNTLGMESNVSVTFQKQGNSTLMTLVHSDLPGTDEGRGHEKGWNYFMQIFCDQFGDGSKKPYSWEEAHSQKKE